MVKAPTKTETTASVMDAWSMMFAPQARMAEAMIGQNIEMLDFIKTRFERDKAMLGELAEASDPIEAAKLWQDFWSRLFTDYSVETTKLASHAGEIAETALRSATEEGAALMTMVAKKA
ncbi:phasin protein [Rhodobacter sp. JA431]|uniref:phasin family protein n=1 Tax=Rhodobacter sp. JA431 TaxID=570013 RepID=UPI000BCAF7ED|nr:phasin family protein [Rhodobacter sp. JA431]SOC14217.1 phasin protein [Rhodobacter sp. JA431]